MKCKNVARRQLSVENYIYLRDLYSRGEQWCLIFVVKDFQVGRMLDAALFFPESLSPAGFHPLRWNYLVPIYSGILTNWSRGYPIITAAASANRLRAARISLLREPSHRLILRRFPHHDSFPRIIDNHGGR